MPAERHGTFGYISDPVFLACTGVYAINRFFIKPHLHAYSPFFHGHLNDCLFVPVALPVFLLIYRWLGLRPDNEPPRFWEMALHLVVWCLFYKWFAPKVLHHGVPDPLDLLCYAGGGLAAWILWQRHWLRRVLFPVRVS